MIPLPAMLPRARWRREEPLIRRPLLRKSRISLGVLSTSYCSGSLAVRGRQSRGGCCPREAATATVAPCSAAGRPPSGTVWGLSFLPRLAYKGRWCTGAKVEAAPGVARIPSMAGIDTSTLVALQFFLMCMCLALSSPSLSCTCFLISPRISVDPNLGYGPLGGMLSYCWAAASPHC
jgi:hypothetical protein